MIDLKPLTMTELEWVRVLRNKNLQYFFDTNEVTPYQHKMWYERYQYKKNYDFYIIVFNNIKVGTISVCDKGKYREIGNIIIDEQFRRQGIFKKTMEMIERQYQAPFMLEVFANNIIALEAYRSLGYKERSIILMKP